jgi:hypothetical protein
MEFHLYSLSTFKPHPKAEKHIIEFPHRLNARSIMLDFQICDDALYVMSKGMGMFGGEDGLPDLLYGWQWTTGRVHVKLQAPEQVSFESLVLLTPSSFCIPTAIARVGDGVVAPNDLTPATFRQLHWTHHLQLYAYPPLADHAPAGPWTAQHVATIDMPRIKNRFLEGVPPMQMTIRTDPPPRTFNSPYPLHAPPPYLPDPESGVAIITFTLQHGFLPMRHPEMPPDPMFTLIVPKKTLAAHLPEPSSPLLRESYSEPVTVVPFDSLAPDCRFLGPDRVASPWVCYVYQDRYVAPYARVVGTLDMDDSDEEDEEEPEHVQEIIELCLQVFDFDPRRVRKERLDRARRLPPGMEARDERLEGDVDGIDLVLAPTRIKPVPCLTDEEIVTGQNLPFIMVEKETDSVTPLIDGQRILTLKKQEERAAHAPVHAGDDTSDDSDEDDTVDIMEF